MSPGIIHHPEYEELLEEHLHLSMVLHHLLLSAKADTKPSVFLEELKHVRERVYNHFAFEEQGGYLHGAMVNAEHLRALAAALLQEHSSLLQQLEKLIDWAERSSGDLHLSAEFVREIEVLVRRCQEHEHRENELVQRAANDEISAID